MTTPRLAARGIVKRYGGVTALAGVDFEVHAGAVNVLIGENGAGKSTLMRILAGVERLDGGRLMIDGREVALAGVRDAARHGIGIVHQELSLCPNLTVAENIFLAEEGEGLLVDRGAERLQTVAVLERLGVRIDPDVPVGTLSVGEQQVVEIARALSRNISVLILDEPTSALSTNEIENLFRVIGDLRAAGVAIVYISHRMQEIERIGDHVTILRDGKRVANAPRGQFTISWIVSHMLGEQVSPGARSHVQPGRVVLRVEDLTAVRHNGNIAVDAVNLHIRAGEVTAIYGLLGAGRTELFEALCGARLARGGVWLDGADVSRLPLHERLAAGLQFVPEDRKSEGIFPNLAVSRNLSIPVVGRLCRLGLLRSGHESRQVSPMLRRMGVKAASPDLAIGALSGGNQQKVLIGRSLMPGPKLLLLDEPGRGVDVAARAEIFSVMRLLAADGMAILFSTSDLPDAMGAADRILTMAGGRITADIRAAEASEEALVRAASASLPAPHQSEAA